VTVFINPVDTNSNFITISCFPNRQFKIDSLGNFDFMTGYTLWYRGWMANYDTCQLQYINFQPGLTFQKDFKCYKLSSLSTCNVKVTCSDTIICSGSTTIIKASGASSYSWYPSANLNTNAGSLVSAAPPSNSAYTVIGKI